jgi:hypothetical protein
MTRREELEAWAEKLEPVNPAMAARVRALLAEMERARREALASARRATNEEVRGEWEAGFQAGWTWALACGGALAPSEARDYARGWVKIPDHIAAIFGW